MTTTPTLRDRIGAAIAAMSDDEIDDAVRRLGEGEHLVSLAQALNVKAQAILSLPSAASLVRTRTFAGAPARRGLVALALAGPCSDDCIDRLGDASDDPTRADMDGVLDGLVEDYGAAIIRMMLLAYPAIDAPCTRVFLEILDTDERFALDEASYAAARELAQRAPSETPLVEVDEHTLDVARKEREARIATAAAKLKKSNKKKRK